MKDQHRDLTECVSGACGKADRCLIRIPLIPEFNTDEDRERSITELKQMGFTRFDKFEYKTDINK